MFLPTLPLLKATDTPQTRLMVCGVAIVFGVIMILVGRQNIITRRAEESGRRRAVNAMMGRSNSYEGGTAVTMGVIRVICGIGAIIFGIVFLFVGPFLAND
jgi:hypothetical protein